MLRIPVPLLEIGAVVLLGHDAKSTRQAEGSCAVRAARFEGAHHDGVPASAARPTAVAV